VHNKHVDRARTHQRVGDFERLLAGVRLRNQEVVGGHPDLKKKDHVERMLGVDEGADAALLLRFGNGVQRQSRLARRLRPVDFDDAAARQAANAERDVEPERPARNRLDVHGLVVLAELHDRALAELALNLAERGGQGFRLIHGRSFDETQGRLTHVALLMAGIRRTDNARPKSPRRRRNRLVKVNVPYLFSVRNMFFSKGYWSLSMV